ncbi:MAG: sulfotransferase, partial [Bacteroidetes bacterium]|nr:sulfotransferase [Bacteroidota bacterium]
VAEPLHHIENIYKSLSLAGFENAKPHFEEELKAYRDYSKNKFTMDEALAEKIAVRFSFAFEKLGYSRNKR